HTAGEGNPVILPLGGIRTGDLIEAPPSGARLQFGLIFQMAKRMLAQSYRPDDGVYLSIADHPLMRHGPYRRDNLAMLLAMVTAEQVIGLDSTFDAYQSAYWKKRHAGREIFEQYLLKEWILTPERPLATWIAEEPYGSRLVAMTRPPRRSRTDETSGRQYVEGLPTKGRLGFSVRTDDRGRLVVDKIDVGRLAYASGLMEGDVIRQVDGRRVSSHRELIARILEGLQGLGATLSIQREGQPMTVVIQPLELSPYDEEYFWDDPEDFLYEPPKVPDSLLLRDTLQSEFDQQ
ncbi:PDZ domain-containing protein, partial [candidate division GN15 bacterium]|nr:PDZ domain-containing protein [candidate division GN15 bacterium]